MRTERIVIVGAGPGGCAAAVQSARLGVAPLLLDRTGEAGGLVASAWSVENYPGLEPLDGCAYVLRLRAHLERFGLHVEAGEVNAVKKSDSGIRLDTDRGPIETEVAILAPGTLPRRLELPGAEELSYELFDLLDRKPERAVVVGGGEMAFDYSLSLARAGARVEILIRDAAPRARGRLADFVAREPKISIHLGTELLAVGRGDTDWTLTVASGGRRDEITCDGVVVAIGRRSGLQELTAELDLSPTGMISTRVPGLFVVGDARLGSLGQAGIAVGDGLRAAMQAIGYLDREDGC
jgi:thioredoxin reductase (NADPH)